MKLSVQRIRALHVHDAAGVAQSLVEVANLMGHPWSMTDVPWYYQRTWSGPAGSAIRMVRRHVWDGTLALQSMKADVVHLHTGQLALHARWLQAPLVLHMHGTDVRTNQYDPRWRETIRYGVKAASGVLYSTPDLGPHLRRLTDSAIYLPVTVRLDQAPGWAPSPNRVLFASRWDNVKGAANQIEVAARLKRVRPDLELVGLNWGASAGQARSAGVTLVERMQPVQYRRWLAGASAVVGQMTDILSVSEMEALAIGVPLISSARSAFYPDLRLLGGPKVEHVVAAVLQTLEDPCRTALHQNGPKYVAETHDAQQGVRTLQEIYAALLAEAK